MQIDITFKNMDSSDALRDYASKRLSKLDKYIDRPTEVHLVLSVEKRRHQADVTVSADGAMINAVETTEDMYAAIDMVMDKLERQIKKHKDKLQDKKGQPRTAQAAPAPAEEEEAPGPRVVYERDYFVKPMSVDEAILQIGVAGRDFLIFRNIDSQRINLVYRRQDGDIGIVEPII